jgi:uncharacterized protein
MKPEPRTRVAGVLAVVAALALFASCAGAASYTELLEGFGESQLAIATPDARMHRFHIWVAQTPRQRAQGLMWIDDLPDDDGMLFVYGTPQSISMWMKNTVMPLDMLFIDEHGRIERVVENTTPYSLDTITSEGDVIAVLELHAGTAARLGIRSGALVLHPFFGTAPAH